MKFKLLPILVILLTCSCAHKTRNEENIKDDFGSIFDLKVLDIKKPDLSLENKNKLAQNEDEEKKYTGKPVSLSFYKADIHDFFRAISEVTDVNFLIHENVRGTVSIEVKNVKWDRLLDTVLEFNKLTSVKKGNLIEIMPRDMADKETEIIYLNFSKAENIAKTIKNKIESQSEKASIIADPSTNSLIVTDIPENIMKIKQMIKKLDKTPKQVLLESLIVEVTLEDTNKLGIGWTFGQDGRMRGVWGNTSFDSSGTLNYPLSDVAEGTGFSYALSVNDGLINATLNAYAQARKAKVLSHPKIVTFDNHKAEMKVVERRFVQTSINSNAGVGVGGVFSNFEERDYGIILEVTPQINDSGNIVLKVHQEVSDLTGVDANGNPISNQRTVDATLLLNNGQTMVLGGLIQEKKKKDNRGLPWFYKIPFIRNLFGASEKLNTRVELLLFIRPHIISNFEDAKAVTNAVANQSTQLKPLQTGEENK